jgi:hypothetical protein
VDRSLLSAGCSAVYSDIVADEVGIHIRPDAFVGVNQSAGPLFTDLSVVEDLTLVVRCVRVGLGNLLFEPLVQRLVLPFADQLGVALRRGITLVKHIIDTAIDQGPLWLELVQLLGLVRDLVRVLAHVASLP